MDSLTVSPMFMDDETNVVVAAYKGSIPYSLYKDNGIYCKILSVLATRQYEPSI